jgi:hypothetical protein
MPEERNKSRGTDKGKTLVELYGDVKATYIKRAQSLYGELNPAFGKVYAR